MNDIQLKFIIKAVETGSFTKVAECYNTTFQTVSYQIENLESECNTKIFNRTNKGCVLTNEGELVYQFAKSTLDNYTSMIRNIQSIDDIRVGVDMRYIPPDLLNYVYSKCQFPLSLVPISYEDMLDEQKMDRIDCYLGYERGIDKDISFIPLVKDFVGIAISPLSPLSSKKRLSYSDLAGQKIHIGKFGWSRRDVVIDKLKDATIIEDTEGDNLESLAIAEVYANYSCAILPCGYSFIFNDKAKVIPLEDETIEYGLYYMTEKTKATKLANAIKTFLAEYKNDPLNK